MAIADGDIIQIRLTSAFNGQVCENVYYYQADGAAGDPAIYALASQAFEDGVVDAVVPFTSVNYIANRISIKNLTNDLDIFEEAINVVGQVPGDSLPAYVTMTVKLQRTTALTRNGSKRYSGIAESIVTAGELNLLPSQRATIANAHSASLSVSGVGGATILRPVIIGRVPQGQPNAGELDISKVNRVASAALGLRITSQNSRKNIQVYT